MVYRGSVIEKKVADGMDVRRGLRFAAKVGALVPPARIATAGR